MNPQEKSIWKKDIFVPSFENIFNENHLANLKLSNCQSSEFTASRLKGLNEFIAETRQRSINFGSIEIPNISQSAQLAINTIQQATQTNPAEICSIVKSVSMIKTSDFETCRMPLSSLYKSPVDAPLIYQRPSGKLEMLKKIRYLKR